MIRRPPGSTLFPYTRSSDLQLGKFRFEVQEFVIQPVVLLVADRRLSEHVIGVIVLPNLLGQDRKSTRLNSSHSSISYAVFCLKKKLSPVGLSTVTKLSPPKL